MAEMSAEEKLVRAAWIAPRYVHTGSWGYIELTPGVRTEEQPYPENRHWGIAVTFARKRQQEIAELREQLNQLVNLSACYCPEAMQIMQRTIDLVQSALTEAQRGMKEEPHGN